MLISTSLNHALTTLVIQRAAELAPPNAKPIGRTALQKILFFMWKKGLPMGYKFRLFTYGPMCSDIFDTVEWLQVDEAIQDVEPDTARSVYLPGPAADEVIRQHEVTLAPWKNIIDQIILECAPFEPEELELRATLTFINSQEQGARRNGPYKEAVLERFRMVKKEKVDQGKFTPERIEKAYQFLIEKNWIAP